MLKLTINTFNILLQLKPIFCCAYLTKVHIKQEENVVIALRKKTNKSQNKKIIRNGKNKTIQREMQQ